MTAFRSLVQHRAGLLLSSSSSSSWLARRSLSSSLSFSQARLYNSNASLSAMKPFRAGTSRYNNHYTMFDLQQQKQNNNKNHNSNARRYYTPLTKEEEEEEKERVKNLTPFAREQELRKLNREIARLQMLQGINTGELYTWTGRYKVLARDYGFPFMAWYASVWAMTAVLIYSGMELGGIDAMALVAKLDSYTGWDLVHSIDPNLGKIGLTIVLNEMIEPLRLPVVIVTTKPVVDRLFPPKV